MSEENTSRSVVGEPTNKPPRVKFKDIFFKGDIRTAMADGLIDVIVPRASELFISFVNAVLRAVMYGDGYYPTDSNGSRRDSTYISYDRPYRDRYRDTRDYDRDRRDAIPIRRNYVDRLDTSRQPIPSYKDPTMSRPESWYAEQVIENMREEIRRKGFVTLLDFYEFAGGESVSTENNYGWTSLPQKPYIEYDRGWWYIHLPKPFVLDRN